MAHITRQFIGGFFVTVILIGTLCGLLVVDLSADRYMPGRFGQIFAITEVESRGVDFSFMGEQYRIHSEPVLLVLEFLEQHPGLVPLPIRAAAGLAEELDYQVS